MPNGGNHSAFRPKSFTHLATHLRHSCGLFGVNLWHDRNGANKARWQPQHGCTMLPPDQQTEGFMQRYEYRVLPAPVRGEKVRGAKTTEERFAQAMTSMINGQAREGWDYCRAETLPSEERAGLMKRRIVHVNVLVFRRELALEVAGPLILGPGAGKAPKIVEIAEGTPPRLGPAPGAEGL